jgi:hypothetical protein
MKPVLRYIRTYFYDTDKRALALVSGLTAILIFINYFYHVDDRISNYSSFPVSFFSRMLLFLIAFGLPYIIYSGLRNKNYFRNTSFTVLVIIAAAVFAFKIAYVPVFDISDNYKWYTYWNHIIYWPALLLITTGILFICWRLFDREQPFYGLTTKQLVWKPYFIMLLIMVPLIAAASTQPDFLQMYPKLKLITGWNVDTWSWWHKLLFELSYGSDFFTIELFFRGFLILAFAKWAGKDAILPMACFYCTIHFGKPLAECISSYFGGMLLGIVVYHTRSIFGGLMVHLGIAWLMELGGYIGNVLK